MNSGTYTLTHCLSRYLFLIPFFSLSSRTSHQQSSPGCPTDTPRSPVVQRGQKHQHPAIGSSYQLASVLGSFSLSSATSFPHSLCQSPGLFSVPLGCPFPFPFPSLETCWAPPGWLPSLSGSCLSLRYAGPYPVITVGFWHINRIISRPLKTPLTPSSGPSLTQLHFLLLSHLYFFTLNTPQASCPQMCLVCSHLNSAQAVFRCFLISCSPPKPKTPKQT